jgi:hypothetical protein
MIIERGGSQETGHRDLATGPIRISVLDPEWNAEADTYEAVLNHSARPGGQFDTVMKQQLMQAIAGTSEFLQSVNLGYFRVFPPLTAGRLARVKRPADF